MPWNYAAGADKAIQYPIPYRFIISKANMAEIQKNLLSLNEASRLTPYSSDYLGLLIRKGRLAGWKEKGRWWTTREAVESYMRKVAEASYAHQENLNVDVPAEKIKMASVNLRWTLILAGACLRYKVRKDENNNIFVEVAKDETVGRVIMVQGE